MKQILFARPELQLQFRMIHPKNAEIIEFMSDAAWKFYRELLCCTSILRVRKIGERDTHYNQKVPYRFIDFDVLVRGDSERLRRMVNEEFQYDPLRPDLFTIPPLEHGTSPHLHVQCIS